MAATIANVVDIDLEQAIAKKYGQGCPGRAHFLHLPRCGEAIMILRPLLLCLFFLSAVPTVVKATSDNQELAVDIGFDGMVRAGHWNPVLVHIPQSLAQTQTRYVAVEAKDPGGQWLRSLLFVPH